VALDMNEQNFLEAMRAAGMTPPTAIEPERFYRFPGIGKGNGNTAGWCRLFADGTGGVFGDWSSDISESWQAQRTQQMTSAEREAFRKHIEEAKAQAATERKAMQAKAAERAAAIWSAAEPASDDHPYLIRKRIKSHGLRVYRGQLQIREMPCDGCLIVPMRDATGELSTLEFISPDGEKRFLTDGRKEGCYFAIGGKPNGSLCIAEGYATAASVHEATGMATAAAMDATNLKPVALALRSKFPDAKLVICADDDYRTDGNPGKSKAEEAAQAVNGAVAVPDFGTDRPEGATDFNDLHKLRGPEAVERAVANATAVARGEARAATENATAGAHEGRIIYRRASDIVAKPVRWLWPGRIARGKVSLLAGNAGLGKSQLTASMAAIVSAGGTWPVDRTHCDQGNVVILSAEDDAEDTLRPRLEAAVADLSRVFILDSVVESQRDGNPAHRSFNLKADLARLANLLRKLKDVALIVIDPLSAYLGGTDSHVNADVRALLMPLAELAAANATAIVCVSHLNKAGGSEAIMRVTGSLAFVAASRAAFLIVRDQENEDRRLFLPLKNNIGKDRTGLAFTVQSVQVKCEAGINESCRVVWEKEAVTVTADEAMTPAPDDEERDALEDAKVFLASLLKDAPLSAKQVYSESREAGHSERTIRRAQKALGVEAAKEGMQGGWVWKLPPKAAKIPEDGHTKSVDAFDKVGHLRHNPELDYEPF
jgi:putative DNA primase/helicase